MKKRLFAEGTTVEVSKTRSEIETLLTKHGATSFASGWEGTRARILFEAHGRRVRFTLELLSPTQPLPGRRMKPEAIYKENKRRWRCLLLMLKAKLEAVANNLVTFEEEFLSFIMVPNSGETVGDWLGPQLAAAYQRGSNMPPLLGAGDAP